MASKTTTQVMMVVAVGTVLLLLALGFVNFGGIGEPTTTATTDTTTTIPPPPTTGTVNIITVDEQGKQVNGEIYVDGAFKGRGQVSVELGIGEHTITYGDVSGYVTPQPTKIVIQGGENLNIRAVYRLATSDTTTLTVKVKVCHQVLGFCVDSPNQLVILSDGQTASTDDMGEASFTVNTNTRYTVTVRHTDYGEQTKQVDVGTAPTTVEFTFTATRLSIIPTDTGFLAILVILGVFIYLLMRRRGG